MCVDTCWQVYLPQSGQYTIIKIVLAFYPGGTVCADTYTCMDMFVEKWETRAYMCVKICAQTCTSTRMSTSADD